MKRRNFINILLGGGIVVWLGSVLSSVIAYLLPPEAIGANPTSVKAASTGEIELGGSKIFQFGNKPGLLIRLEDGEYRAFNASCTHLDCTVQYREDLGVIWCACHNGKFNTKGINIAGPPPRPLEILEVHIQNEDIFVSKSET
jgi:Rieske Fe-S protein